MNVTYTKRIVEKLIALKRNLSLSMDFSSLEPAIDGAVIDNMVFTDYHEAKELLFGYAKNELGFSRQDFDKCITEVACISANDFLKNPYLQDIKLTEFDVDGIKLERAYYKRHEFAMKDIPAQEPSLLKKFKIGMFDDIASTYVLKTDSFVWMSINPMEMRTMSVPISEACGNMLIVGGGLGYFAYMASLNDSVKAITIIENNPVIYEFLKNNIIPQIHKEVKIILCDAYDYMKDLKDGVYDYIYFDIWEDNVSGYDNYIKLVKYEDFLPGCKLAYWIEEAILDTIIVNIYQYMNAKVGTDDFQSYFKMVAPSLWNYLESIPDTISRPEQFDYYFTREFAKQVAKHL